MRQHHNLDKFHADALAPPARLSRLGGQIAQFTEVGLALATKVKNGLMVAGKVVSHFVAQNPNPYSGEQESGWRPLEIGAVADAPAEQVFTTAKE